MHKRFHPDRIADEISDLEGEIASVLEAIKRLKSRYAEGLSALDNGFSDLRAQIAAKVAEAERLGVDCDDEDHPINEELSLLRFKVVSRHAAIQDEYGLGKYERELMPYSAQLASLNKLLAEQRRFSDIVRDPFSLVFLERDYWDGSGFRHSAGPRPRPIPADEAEKMVAEGVARFA